MYVQVFLIEKDDFEFQYHQAFINYKQPDNGWNDLEKDIRNVCKLNPNKFCELLTADPLLSPKERNTWQRYLVAHYFDELSHENQRSLRSVVVEMETPEARFVPSPDDIEMDDLSSENRTVKKVKSIDEQINDIEKLLQKSKALINSKGRERVKTRAGNLALDMVKRLQQQVLIQKPLTRKLCDLITYGLEIAVASGNKEAEALLEAHKTHLKTLWASVQSITSSSKTILDKATAPSLNFSHLSEESKQENSKRLLTSAADLEAVIWGYEISERENEICRDMITKFLQLAIEWGPREETREMFYQEGKKWKFFSVIKEKNSSCPAIIAATRYYLLAASLGHPLASSELIAICKLNPNEFRRTLTQNVALAKEECERWQSYVDRHYPDKTLSPQKSVFAIKASFFESSSENEDDVEKVKLSSTDGIRNSNNPDSRR